MNKVNNIFPTDSVFLHFSTFLADAEKFRQKINEAKYTIKDEQISSRVLNHWHKLNILKDNRIDKKGWRKFSISEMIWIRIVIELRKFDYPLSKIKSVKESLDKANRKDEEQSSCIMLDFYIASTIATNKPIKLLAFSNGEGIIANQNEIDLSLNTNFIKDNYISLDINPIVRKFIPIIQETDYLDYGISNIEKEVRAAFYFEDVKSISIRTLNDKEFLVEKNKIIDSKKELMSLLHKLNFGSVKVDKHGKNKVYTQQEKKKIKK